MELSPTDIRNHHFATQLRGYDKTEVDTFKEQTAQVLEQARQELIRQTMEFEAVKLQLAAIKQFEDTIKDTAIDARRNADATIATAKKEAEWLLQKTKGEVETLIATRHQRIAETEAQLEKLDLTRRAYIQKLRAMITSHLELVEAIISSEAEAKSAAAKSAAHDDLEITDSTEVRRARRETIGSSPSKTTSQRTEEANAPSHIVSVTAPTDPVAASLHAAIRGDETTSKSVDPELAAALEKYGRHETPRHEDKSTASPIPRPNEMVETSSRAEDVPQGFVSNAQESGGVNPQPATLRPGGPIPADVLAKELDAVVQKFTEEMDKAAQS
jgi:cell division initiation protein